MWALMYMYSNVIITNYFGRIQLTSSDIGGLEYLVLIIFSIIFYCQTAAGEIGDDLSCNVKQAEQQTWSEAVVFKPKSITFL